MTGTSEDPTREQASPSPADTTDPQWERAHQVWHLIINTPAHELSAIQRRALFKIVRIKRSEQMDLLQSLPGTVRKGAKIDLASLETGLNQAGISCSLEYVGVSRGDRT